MKFKKFRTLSIYTFWSVMLVQPLLGGAGHDHGAVPGEQHGSMNGPVQITSQARDNLQLKTVKAEFQKLEETRFAIGQVRAIPERHAQVSSRISGQVKELLVSEGEFVEIGTVLALVESRQPGNPPPVIEFIAPQSGIITNLHVFKGTNVEPNTHLMDVIDLNVVYAKAEVYEGQIEGLKMGQHARIRLEAYPNEVFEGVLERLSTAVDESNRTLSAWFRVQNPKYLIRLNMRASFDIIIRSVKKALVVPMEAVLGQNGNSFVFIATDREHLIYEKEPVVTGLSDDRYIEIVKGVHRGDKVVTTGNYQLQYLPVMSMSESDAHQRMAHGEDSSSITEDAHAGHDHGVDLEESHVGHDHEVEDHAHGSEDAHAGHDHGADLEESHIGHDHEVEDHAHGSEDAHAGHDHGERVGSAADWSAYWSSVFWGLFGLSVLLNVGFVIAWMRRDSKRGISEKG